MFVQVMKEEFTWKTCEPEKNSEWRWVPWSEFLDLEPKFIPF